MILFNEQKQNNLIAVVFCQERSLNPKYTRMGYKIGLYGF